MGRDITSFVTLDFRIARMIDQKANPGRSTDFSILLVSSAAGVVAGPVRLSDALAQGFATLTGPIAEQVNDSMVTYHPYMETVRIRLSAFRGLAAVQRNLRGVRFIFDRTTTGSIFLANITLSPDLGSGIPSTPAPPPASRPALQESLLSAAPAPVQHVVHAGSLTTMKSGVKVYNVRGVPYSGGVRLELESDDPFPAGDAILTLRIGSNRILTGNLVDLHHLIFTLTPEEFARVKTGDEVIVQKGISENPSQVWDFGQLNKSQAQPQ